MRWMFQMDRWGTLGVWRAWEPYWLVLLWVQLQALLFWMQLT